MIRMSFTFYDTCIRCQNRHIDETCFLYTFQVDETPVWFSEILILFLAQFCILHFSCPHVPCNTLVCCAIVAAAVEYQDH